MEFHLKLQLNSCNILLLMIEQRMKLCVLYMCICVYVYIFNCLCVSNLLHRVQSFNYFKFVSITSKTVVDLIAGVTI